MEYRARKTRVVYKRLVVRAGTLGARLVRVPTPIFIRDFYNILYIKIARDFCLPKTVAEIGILACEIETLHNL